MVSKPKVNQVNSRRCLTAGILNRNINTNFAHIEIANFTDVTQNVIITVFTWGTPTATPIPGCTFNINVAANSRRTLNCSVIGRIHYEVRVNIPENVDLIVNVFGVMGGLADPNFRANQEGNTVLFQDLVPLSPQRCGIS
jgi:hypothetical protein